jgi:AcrR family transcriptional regulator
MPVSKRERLLDCASALFHEHGFHATGIERILEASGCAKMTLYNHFRSKQELILACVRRTDEAWRNGVMKKIENSSKDPRERLLAVFDVAAEMIDDDRFCGCFFVKAANEFRGPKDPIRVAAAENKRLFVHYISRIAEDAGAAKPEILAKSLLMMLDGAIAYAHVSGDTGAPALARQNAEYLIDQYLL